jgi:hypothetical protein
MDPQSDKLPGLGLPQPSMPQGSAMPPNQPYMPMPPVGQAPTAMSMPAMQAPAAGGLPMAALPGAGAPMPQMQQPALDAPAPDENSDSLDEEWVQKAKTIVERTKNDPYAESQELSKVKADFLRIRYNKQVKIAEDQSK